jgi:thiamine biosynthesis protein ThiC
MVEGPGHVPLNENAWNMETERKVCNDARLYRLACWGFARYRPHE